VAGFELEAVDYLVKPIKFDRFVKALEKALNLMTMRSKDSTITSRSTSWMNANQSCR
jgi:DNA-binding LytR/AlgR family response regulator